MIKLTDTILDEISPNTIENDLLYASSVLNKIKQVIEKTYGPYSGYVAQVNHDKHGNPEYSYTKDGEITLSSLSFHVATDNDLLMLVRLLAGKIKMSSGDGSTTATMLLANMVRVAAEYLLNEKDEKLKYNRRIHTPKALEYLVGLLKKEFQNNKKTVETYADLNDLAYISLNNDDLLLSHFSKLFRFLQKEQVEINSDLQIAVKEIDSTEFAVSYTSGFDLIGGLPVLSQAEKIENVRFIMLRDYITMESVHFVFDSLLTVLEQDLHKRFPDTNRVIFILSGLETRVIYHLRERIKTIIDNGGTVCYDFIVVPFSLGIEDELRDDLALYTNTREHALKEYNEKREYNANDTTLDTTIDNENTNGLVKWKSRLYTNEQGVKVRDYNYGFDKFINDVYSKLGTSILTDVYINKGSSRIELKTGNNTESYQNRIAELIEKSKLPDDTMATNAKIRLARLSSSRYVISVPRRISDSSRVFKAFKDAAGAINSSINFGYHMGGSIGLRQVLVKAIDKTDAKIHEDSFTKLKETLETAKLILQFMLQAVEEITELLIPLDKRDDEYDINKIIESKFINEETFSFGDTRVISPIETDIIMTEVMLYQFSNLFSSLIFEYPQVNDVMYVSSITKSIKNNLLSNDNTNTEEKVELPTEEEINDIEDISNYLAEYKPITGDTEKLLSDIAKIENKDGVVLISEDESTIDTENPIIDLTSDEQINDQQELIVDEIEPETIEEEVQQEQPIVQLETPVNIIEAKPIVEIDDTPTIVISSAEVSNTIDDSNPAFKKLEEIVKNINAKAKPIDTSNGSYYTLDAFGNKEAIQKLDTNSATFSEEVAIKLPHGGVLKVPKIQEAAIRKMYNL